MSRTGRTNVEHDTASKARSAMGAMPAGVAKALEKVKETNEETMVEKVPEVEIPSGLRDLIFFGKYSEDITLGPYVFKISTLTNKQQKDIFKKLFPLSNEDKISSLKGITLSEAIVSVNGASLESLYTGSNSNLSINDKREYVISEMQSNLVDRLFQKYESLVRKSSSIFENDDDMVESIKN
jgi:hypothetical protein